MAPQDFKVGVFKQFGQWFGVEPSGTPGSVLVENAAGQMPSFKPVPGGAAGGVNKDVQYNNAGVLGGDIRFQWDAVAGAVDFAIGCGLSFVGTKHPTTMVGGDDGAGDSAIIFDNATDDYITFKFNQYTDFYRPTAGMGFVNADYSVVDFFDDNTFSVGQPLFVAQHSAQVNEDLTVGGVINGLVFDLTNEVTANASALNEPTCGVAVLNIKIGTGFPQNTPPTPRGWLWDWSQQGPIGLQPHLLNGATILLNNYFNGSPADSKSGAYWAVTKPGAGADLDSVHAAASTFANDVAFGAVGYSTGGNIGWTVGFKAGGFGSGWDESGTASKLGTAADFEGYVTAGISLHTPAATTAPDIKFTGFFEGSEMTAPVAGAANTGRIFFQDNGAGKTQLMVIFNTGAAQQIAIQP
jgi:hypothetical protein